MIRRQALRSLQGSRRLASLNTTRAFAATPRRNAEVELTVGMLASVRRMQKNRCANTHFADGKKVSIEGTTSISNYVPRRPFARLVNLQDPSDIGHSGIISYSSLRKGRHSHSSILLP